MRTLAFLMVVMSSPALAASFPCDKASSKVEVMICKEAELSTLDEHLAQYYSGANAALGDGASCLRDDQRAWLRTVRNACTDPACLKRAYLGRLAELHALQPGASAIRYMELPKAPSLAWIVPPAGDKVAAPPRPNLPPLSVRGKLVNDVADGDGFVVQADDGRKVILLLSMFLEGPSPDYLTALSKDPAARFEVRGSAEKDPRGAQYFSQSRCRFVYRLPQ